MDMLIFRDPDKSVRVTVSRLHSCYVTFYIRILFSIILTSNYPHNHAGDQVVEGRIILIPSYRSKLLNVVPLQHVIIEYCLLARERVSTTVPPLPPFIFMRRCLVTGTRTLQPTSTPSIRLCAMVLSQRRDLTSIA